MSPGWRCCPYNIGPSGIIMPFLPGFNLFLLGKMGFGPFRWAGNHCVVPRVGSRANKRLPQRLRGAGRKHEGVSVLMVHWGSPGVVAQQAVPLKHRCRTTTACARQLADSNMATVSYMFPKRRRSPPRRISLLPDTLREMRNPDF